MGEMRKHPTECPQKTTCSHSMKADFEVSSRSCACLAISDSRESLTSSSFTFCSNRACECSSKIPVEQPSRGTVRAIVCSWKQRTPWMPRPRSDSTSVGTARSCLWAAPRSTKGVSGCENTAGAMRRSNPQVGACSWSCPNRPEPPWPHVYTFSSLSMHAVW